MRTKMGRFPAEVVAGPRFTVAEGRLGGGRLALWVDTLVARQNRETLGGACVLDLVERETDVPSA